MTWSWSQCSWWEAKRPGAPFTFSTQVAWVKMVAVMLWFLAAFLLGFLFLVQLKMSPPWERVQMFVSSMNMVISSSQMMNQKTSYWTQKARHAGCALWWYDEHGTFVCLPWVSAPGSSAVWPMGIKGFTTRHSKISRHSSKTIALLNKVKHVAHELLFQAFISKFFHIRKKKTVYIVSSRSNNSNARISY